MTTASRSPQVSAPTRGRRRPEEIRFRSYRRRFLLLILPIAVLSTALLSFVSARAVRAVATPIIREGSENFLCALSLVLENSPTQGGEAERILRAFSASPAQCFMLVDQDGSRLTVGRPRHTRECFQDLERILDRVETGTVIHDHGPFGTWMTVVHHLGDGRILLMEKTVDGPGTLYSVAALAVTLVTLVVSFLFAVVLSSVLFKPLAARLERLQSALMRFEAGEQGLRLETAEGASNELDEVDRAFNRMAERIEELEEERKRQAEMKRALLADLAHDINTPIAVLRGYAETLVEKGASMDDADLLSVHARILGQSYYVQAIVEDLLTMADAQGRQLRVRPEELAVDEVFDAIVDAYEPLASQAGMALIGDGRGLVVYADPLRIRQILNNLIRNALLHARGATLIELAARREAGGVLIRVEDNGPGIPADLVESLFERRRRGSSPGGDGWGLGLAIVRTLAQRHGGWARYRPRKQGACFEIFFPDPSSEQNAGGT